MPPVKSRRNNKLIDPELDSAAWPRFEKLVKAAAKAGPKPHFGKNLSRGENLYKIANRPVHRRFSEALFLKASRINQGF